MTTPPQIDWLSALDGVLREPARVRPVFQPIVDLKRGVVTGYELLSRFEGPPFSPPEAWFRAAAEHGRGGELEALVLRRGLAMRDELPVDCFMTLNVSPHSLLSRHVQDALRAARPLDGVVLEITEQTEVDDYEVLDAALKAARAARASIAVDDAGSAYASLRQIMELRPEFVKVDREFVAGIDLDETKAAMVQMLGELANRIDSWVVAEGVERSEELDCLVRLRVPLSQGYLLGAPTPEMAALDDELGTRMRSLSYARLSEAAVGALVEPVPVVRDQDGGVALARLFGDRVSGDFVPVVDSRRRPVGLIARSGLLADGDAVVPVLTVMPGSRVSDVALRAMTRPAAERFVPLVCCDEAGRYLGLVRVERLVAELAK